MQDVDFLNKGVMEGDISHSYYVIDLVAEKLTTTLKDRLEKYNDRQRIHFRSKKELIDNIERKVEGLKSLLQDILDIPLVSKPEMNDLVNKKQIKSQIEKLGEIASRFVSQYKYENALELY